MAGLCKAVIIGNLGSDPELRYSAAGRPFARFRVACNRNYTAPDGERREETEWFGVTAFGKTAEICNQYLHKGSRVYVEGRLSSRSWDAADGQKRFSIDITANEVQILDSRARDGDMDQASADEASDLDAIPF